VTRGQVGRKEATCEQLNQRVNTRSRRARRISSAFAKFFTSLATRSHTHKSFARGPGGPWGKSLTRGDNCRQGHGPSPLRAWTRPGWLLTASGPGCPGRVVSPTSGGRTPRSIRTTVGHPCSPGPPAPCPVSSKGNLTPVVRAKAALCVSVLTCTAASESSDTQCSSLSIDRNRRELVTDTLSMGLWVET
jgi:hypothetical protein